MEFGVAIYQEHGEFEVWVGPSDDLRDDNVINAFIAGIGPTRDAAIAGALRELEAVTELLRTRADTMPVRVIGQETR